MNIIRARAVAGGNVLEARAKGSEDGKKKLIKGYRQRGRRYRIIVRE